MADVLSSVDFSWIPGILTNEAINILKAKVQAKKPPIDTKEKFLWM
jgi:hypothetical protein